MSIVFWGIIGLILLIIDAVTSVLLLLGFGLAGLITMVFTKYIPFYHQILLFVASGTLMSLYIVPKLKKHN